MRAEPSILHLDMDAFYAAVEQLHKPSLRGRPVVVGGLGPRGVVATASYEARRHGIASAMTMGEARRRCPHAVFLAPRFRAYQAVSAVVMDVLRGLSPVVEPLSLDEAYVDLSGTPVAGDLSADRVRAIGAELRAAIRTRTGLAASVGAGTSKLVAKIASDMAKPDGLRVVAAGEELAMLRPLPVTRLWGVGPATARRLNRAGVETVADLASLGERDLVAMLGQAHGQALYRQARGVDDRPVSAERETKSISVEETFDHDIADRAQLAAWLDLLTDRLVGRLRSGGHAGRTVTVKVRRYDFTTLARSETLPAPTDSVWTVRQLARALLAQVDTTGGVRLLGVGVSHLTEYAQGELFGPADSPATEPVPQAGTQAGAVPVTQASADAVTQAGTESVTRAGAVRARTAAGVPAADAPAAGVPAADAPAGCLPGADVEHRRYGRGWVQEAGGGRVTVRFESPDRPYGGVLVLPAGDPELRSADPPATGPGTDDPRVNP